MRPTASSLLLKCRWSTAPRRHNQPEIVASGVINKKHTMSPKRVRFSCWGPGFLSHCKQNVDKSSVSPGRMFYPRQAARLQNADLPLWGGNVDHMQYVALAVPRELLRELLPCAACCCAPLAVYTHHIIYTAVIKAALRRSVLHSTAPAFGCRTVQETPFLMWEKIISSPDNLRVQKMLVFCVLF